MGALFSMLDEITRLEQLEHTKEIERIKNREPSDYPKTVYIYSEDEIPKDYVKYEGFMRSVYMLRKYGRRVFRNTKKKVYVIPEVREFMGKEYLFYIACGPIPESGEAVIPITKKR